MPFEKYAAAAQSLTRPASAARALQNGAPNIERADKLVQLIAKQKGLSHPAIDAQVALVDARLEANRKKAAAGLKTSIRIGLKIVCLQRRRLWQNPARGAGNTTFGAGKRALVDPNL